MDDTEKILVRLDEIGYSPDSYTLLGRTARHALLLISTGCVIVRLDDGQETAHFTDRWAAIDVFASVADRDSQNAPASSE